MSSILSPLKSANATKRGLVPVANVPPETNPPATAVVASPSTTARTIAAKRWRRMRSPRGGNITGRRHLGFKWLPEDVGDRELRFNFLTSAVSVYGCKNQGVAVGSLLKKVLSSPAALFLPMEEVCKPSLVTS